MKLKATIAAQLAPTKCRVLYDPEWEEYVVQVSRQGKRVAAEDYHTDDFRDALLTGKAIVNRDDTLLAELMKHA